jgi:serine/threonine protein kinase
MKKLEPYFIMEFSKRIYKFSELIFDQPSNKTDLNQEQYVYAIFEQNFGDLHTYMKEKKRLNEPEAKHIFRQCVKAIRDCHENGIIVRDIKLKKFVFIDREK